MWFNFVVHCMPTINHLWRSIRACRDWCCWPAFLLAAAAGDLLLRCGIPQLYPLLWFNTHILSKAWAGCHFPPTSFSPSSGSVFPSNFPLLLPPLPCAAWHYLPSPPFLPTLFGFNRQATMFLAPFSGMATALSLLPVLDMARQFLFSLSISLLTPFPSHAAHILTPFLSHLPISLEGRHLHGRHACLPPASLLISLLVVEVMEEWY